MSNNLWDVFETDVKKELDGVWHEIDLGLGDKNPRFRMGMMSDHNPRYREAEQKHTLPFALILSKKPTNDKEKQRHDQIRDEIRLKTMADGLIYEWENITDREDKPIEYSFENAYYLLDNMRHLYDALAIRAAKLDNYRREKQETESKNS